MRLSRKFGIPFVALTLVLGLVSTLTVSTTLRTLEEQQLPSLMRVENIALLSRVVQAETLELVATSEPEAREQHAEASRALVDALEALLASHAGREQSMVELVELVEAARALDQQARDIVDGHERRRLSRAALGVSEREQNEQLREQLEQLERAELTLIDRIDRASTATRAEIHDGLSSAMASVLVSSMLAVLITLGIMLALSRGLARGLAALTYATERMVVGDLTVRASVTTRDELATLAAGFNTLASRLNEALGDDLATRIVELEANEIELRAANEQAVLARQEAERANAAKNDFLANMSHELRTPLNAVLGMSGLLADTRLDQEQQEFNHSVRTSAETLLELINDILDFSKIEAGRLVLETQPFSIQECIESALELVAVRAGHKHIELVYLIEHDVPPVVIGDVTRTRQILVNLLSNAVKFTDHGEVVVRVQRHGEADVEADELELELSVRDTGIGIPEADRSSLFEKFTQVDASTTRKYGGSGLGLAICKSLAEAMNGSISVESTLGVGSVFTVVIRVGRGVFASEARTQRASDQDAMFDREMATRQPLRILIAEDNVINQKFAVHALARLGYRADVVNNGLEVLEALERQSYDVILMDVLMPEMDGIEAAQRIRKLAPGGTRPWIIAVTANAMPGERLRLKAAGMDDYVTKPVRITELIASLRRHRPQAAEPMLLQLEAFEELASSVEDLAGLRELIDLFERDTTKLLSEAHGAIAAKDAKTARRMLHTIKSSSAVFGLVRISSACAHMEEHLDDDRLAELVPGLAELEAELPEAMAELERALELVRSR